MRYQHLRRKWRQQFCLQLRQRILSTLLSHFLSAICRQWCRQFCRHLCHHFLSYVPSIWFTICFVCFCSGGMHKQKRCTKSWRNCRPNYWALGGNCWTVICTQKYGWLLLSQNLGRTLCWFNGGGRCGEEDGSCLPYECLGQCAFDDGFNVCLLMWLCWARLEARSMC